MCQKERKIIIKKYTYIYKKKSIYTHKGKERYWPFTRFFIFIIIIPVYPYHDFVYSPIFYIYGYNAGNLQSTLINIQIIIIFLTIFIK